MRANEHPRHSLNITVLPQLCAGDVVEHRCVLNECTMTRSTAVVLTLSLILLPGCFEMSEEETQTLELHDDHAKRSETSFNTPPPADKVDAKESAPQPGPNAFAKGSALQVLNNNTITASYGSEAPSYDPTAGNQVQIRGSGGEPYGFGAFGTSGMSRGGGGNARGVTGGGFGTVSRGARVGGKSRGVRSTKNRKVAPGSRKASRRVVRKTTPPVRPKGSNINSFVNPAEDRLSTFSVDVDSGSYTLARKHLKRGMLPSKSQVRVEEFVNFFEYDYKTPRGRVPFEVDFEAAPSPFDDDQVLLRVGVQGRKISEKHRKPAHLVFLVDVSGSMHSADKLPLAQRSLHKLVNQLKEGDTVAICTYAGRVSEVLQPTGMGQRAVIHEAIESLTAGGATAMHDGLETAYKMAYKTLKPNHINRVIVLSDGDANVGRATHKEILKRIKHFTQEGVTLSTIGFGMGNYRDTMMEQLANKGNGNYFYIDTEREARRVFQKQLASTLQVIAKDVKIQVEFNPDAVASYRLIGYENRNIHDADFRNDAVDAGEIGAGHTVTAIYALKLKPNAESDLNPATVMVRAKAPRGARAKERTYPLTRAVFKKTPADTSKDFRVAVTAAAFAEKLRGSEFAADWSWETILGLLEEERANLNEDTQELLTLIETAQSRSSTTVVQR